MTQSGERSHRIRNSLRGRGDYVFGVLDTIFISIRLKFHLDLFETMTLAKSWSNWSM
jgi:hypothetical protein